MALNIVISNEEDAWHWLERALKDDPELDDSINLKFDNWPTIDLQFKGQDFSSSVPTRIMPSLIDAQKEIYKAFSQFHYGQQNARKLTKNDRDRLELVVKVGNGSSKLLTNLSEVFTEFAKSAASRMESKHVLYAVLLIALSWGGTVFWKDWLDNQAKIKEIESRVEISQLEKEKLAIFADALTKEESIKELTAGIDEFRNDTLHKLKHSDAFTVPAPKKMKGLIV